MKIQYISTYYFTLKSMFYYFIFCVCFFHCICFINKLGFKKHSCQLTDAKYLISMIRNKK